MDENRLLERIRSAYSHATPDCLDKILASCEDRKGTVINMNERKKNRFVPIAIAAALVLAGNLAQRKVQATGAVGLSTSSALFAVLLLVIIALIGALSLLPAFALGPLAEQFMGTF